MGNKKIYTIAVVLMLVLGAGLVWLFSSAPVVNVLEEDPCVDLVVIEDGIVDEEEKDPLAFQEPESPGEMPAEDSNVEDGDVEVSGARALETWEALVRKFSETETKEGENKNFENLQAFKNSFDSLTEQEKEEAIHDALNLLPNGHEHFLAIILLDENEPEGVLESIFSDMMNRDERMRISMFRLVAQNAAHPLSSKAIEYLCDIEEDAE